MGEGRCERQVAPACVARSLVYAVRSPRAAPTVDFALLAHVEPAVDEEVGMGVEGCEDSSRQTDKRRTVYTPLTDCSGEQIAQHSGRGAEQTFVGQRTFFVPGRRGGELARLGEPVVQKQSVGDSLATLQSDTMRRKNERQAKERRESKTRQQPALPSLNVHNRRVYFFTVTDSSQLGDASPPFASDPFAVGRSAPACLLRPASPKESPHERAYTSLTRE